MTSTTTARGDIKSTKFRTLTPFMLSAAIALTLSLSAYCGFDAAFTYALDDIRRYPRRFPAELAAVPAALLLAAELIKMVRLNITKRLTAVFITAGVLLSAPALFLWDALAGIV